MRKLNILDKYYNASELSIPILNGKSYLYWFETDPTNEEFLNHERYDLWKKQYDYLKSVIEVLGYTYAVGAKTIFDIVAYDVDGNGISYFDIFQGAKIEYINGRTIPALENLVTNSSNPFTVTTGWGNDSTALIGISSNNDLILYGNNTSRYLYAYQEIVNTTNNIIYFKARVRLNNQASWISVYDGNTSTNRIDNPPVNTWFEISNVIKVTGSAVYVLADYLDSSSQNTSNMEINYVISIDLTASHGVTETSGEAYDNAVADIEAMLELNGGYITTTNTTHLEDSEFKSVGKNLFDGVIVQGDIVGATGDDIVEEIRARGQNDISIKPQTTYTVSVPSGYIFVRSHYYTDTAFISFDTFDLQTGTFTTPVGTTRVRLSFRNITNTTITASDLVNLSLSQIELGTVATTYEAYVSDTQKIINDRLSSLPNGIKDIIRYDNGAYVLDRYVAEYTLQSSDFNSYFTGATNLDYVVTKKPLDSFIYNNTQQTNAVIGSLLVDGYVPKILVDSINNINTSTNNDNETFIIAVAKGTYASLAEAQTALAGTKIWYQLATPLLANETLVATGYLLGVPNVTYYQEQDVLVSYKVNKYTDVFNEVIEGPLDSHYDLGWFATEPTSEQVDTWEAMYNILKFGVSIPKLFVITEPIGLGNRYNLLTVGNKVYGHEMDFAEIQFKVNFGINYNAYLGYNYLINLLKDNECIIEYDWGNGSRYGDCRLVQTPKTEKNTFNLIVSNFLFRKLNPFYIPHESTDASISISNTVGIPIQPKITFTAEQESKVTITKTNTTTLATELIVIDLSTILVESTVIINPEDRTVLFDDGTNAYEFVDKTENSFFEIENDGYTYDLTIVTDRGTITWKVEWKQWVLD